MQIQSLSTTDIEILSSHSQLDTAAAVNESQIENIKSLVNNLKCLFSQNLPYSEVKVAIENILHRVDLTTTETNKFTFFDNDKPYTRNLISTDGKHYTLLLLCWGPGKSSKIHNHPCDGCFIKTISGCIKETRYVAVESNDEIQQSGTKFYCEGQVSYMTDELGLHKISNPNHNVGAVTLHLYTPPFNSCKVWSCEGKGELSKVEKGVMGFFSVYGLRTPNLEAKPGIFARMQRELLLRHGNDKC